MKRLSRKIKKRLSLSSHERHNSVKELYGGVSQSRQLPIPHIPDGDFHSSYIYPPGNSVDAAIQNRPRNASEPVLDLRDNDSDHHDYSTLDGEEEVFEESDEKAQTSPQVQPASGSPTDVDAALIASQNCNSSLESRNVHKNFDYNQCSPSDVDCVILPPMLQEFQKLARQGWYWGPMTREQAEKKLTNAPEASFLVRDSSDERYILSLSFRSHHRTLHARIAHSGMKFSFYEDNPRQAYASVVELIESSMRGTNEQGVFCYSRSRHPHSPTFPVRLLHPVSRFTEVRPLQDLCRFVIRQSTRIDHIQKLPLPKPIKGYLNQSYF